MKKENPSSQDIIVDVIRSENIDLNKPKEIFRQIETLLGLINKTNLQNEKKKIQTELASFIKEVTKKINEQIESATEESDLNNDWVKRQEKNLGNLKLAVLNLTTLKSKERESLNGIIEQINNKLEEIKNVNDELKRSTSTFSKIKNVFKNLVSSPKEESLDAQQEEKTEIIHETEEDIQPEVITEQEFESFDDLEKVNQIIVETVNSLLSGEDLQTITSEFQSLNLNEKVQSLKETNTANEFKKTKDALDKLTGVIKYIEKGNNLNTTNKNILNKILKNSFNQEVKTNPPVTPETALPQNNADKPFEDKNKDNVENESESITNSEEVLDTATEAQVETTENPEGINTDEAPVEVDTEDQEKTNNNLEDNNETENQELINSATSFDELIDIIQQNRISITNSEGELQSTEDLVTAINLAKAGQLAFNLVTRNEGFRDKLKSLSEQVKTTEASAETATGQVTKENDLNADKTEQQFKVEINPEELEKIKKLQFESSLYNQEKLECDPIYKYLKETANLTDEQIKKFDIVYRTAREVTKSDGTTAVITKNHKNYHDLINDLKNFTPEERNVYWESRFTGNYWKPGDVFAMDFFDSKNGQGDNFLAKNPQHKEALNELMQKIRKMEVEDVYQKKIDNNELNPIPPDKSEREFLEAFKSLKINSVAELFSNLGDFEMYQTLKPEEKKIVLDSIAREVRHSAKAYGLEKFEEEKKSKLNEGGIFKKLANNIGFSFSEEKKRFDYEKEYLSSLNKDELSKGVSILVGTLNVFKNDGEQVITEYLKFIEKNSSVVFDKNSLATINGILNNKNESWAKAINDRLLRTFTGKAIGASAGLFIAGSLGLATMPALLLTGGVVGGVMGTIRATKKRREESFLKRGSEVNELKENESLEDVINNSRYIDYNKLKNLFTDVSQIEQVEAILNGNLIIWSNKNALEEKNELIKLIIQKKFQTLEIKKDDDKENKKRVTKIITWMNRYGLKGDAKLYTSLGIGAFAGIIVGGAGRLMHDAFSSGKTVDFEVSNKNTSNVPVEQVAVNPKITEAKEFINSFGAKAKEFVITEKDGTVIIKRDGYDGTYEINNDEITYKSPGEPEQVLKKGDDLENGWKEKNPVSNEDVVKEPNKPSKEDMDNQAEKKMEEDKFKKPTEKPAPKTKTTPPPIVDDKTTAEPVTKNKPDVQPAPKVEETTPAPQASENIINTKNQLDDLLGGDSAKYGFKITTVEGNPDVVLIDRNGYEQYYYTIDEKGITAHSIGNDQPEQFLPKGKDPSVNDNWETINKTNETQPSTTAAEEPTKPTINESIEKIKNPKNILESNDHTEYDKEIKRYIDNIFPGTNTNKISTLGDSGVVTINYFSDNIKGTIAINESDEIVFTPYKSSKNVSTALELDSSRKTVLQVGQSIEEQLSKTTNESGATTNSSQTNFEEINSEKGVKNNIANTEQKNVDVLRDSKFFDSKIMSGMSPEQLSESEELVKSIFGEKTNIQLKENNFILSWAKSIFDKPTISHNLIINEVDAYHQDDMNKDEFFREIILYKRLQEQNITENSLFKTLEKILKTEINSTKTTINNMEVQGDSKDKYWTAIKNAKLEDIIKK